MFGLGGGRMPQPTPEQIEALQKQMGGKLPDFPGAPGGGLPPLPPGLGGKGAGPAGPRRPKLPGLPGLGFPFGRQEEMRVRLAAQPASIASTRRVPHIHASSIRQRTELTGETDVP